MDVTVNPAVFETEINNKLLECVCRASGLEGEVASFGIMDRAGFTEQFLAFVMAHASQSFVVPSRKNLHLFGRFAPDDDPLDPADAECPFVVSGKWRPGQYAGPDAETLRSLCGRHLGEGRVFAHPGRYGETIAALPPQSLFCLLHMNCQLYGPTIEVLAALFERKMIAEGTLIMFAGWNANRSSPRFGERRAWAECVDRFGIELSDGGAYGLTAQMFIVHDYRGASTIRSAKD